MVHSWDRLEFLVDAGTIVGLSVAVIQLWDLGENWIVSGHRQDASVFHGHLESIFRQLTQHGEKYGADQVKPALQALVDYGKLAGTLVEIGQEWRQR